MTSSVTIHASSISTRTWGLEKKKYNNKNKPTRPATESEIEADMGPQKVLPEALTLSKINFCDDIQDSASTVDKVMTAAKGVSTRSSRSVHRS